MGDETKKTAQQLRDAVAVLERAYKAMPPGRFHEEYSARFREWQDALAELTKAEVEHWREKAAASGHGTWS